MVQLYIVTVILLNLGNYSASLKVLLHYAIFHATYLTMLLMTQVVIKDTETATCLMLLLLQALQKVELDSTFHNNCGNNFINFFNIAQCNTPCNLSQCLARSANQDPYYALLGCSFVSCWQSLCTV